MNLGLNKCWATILDSEIECVLCTNFNPTKKIKQIWSDFEYASYHYHKIYAHIYNYKNFVNTTYKDREIMQNH